MRRKRKRWCKWDDEKRITGIQRNCIIVSVPCTRKGQEEVLWKENVRSDGKYYSYAI
jgi:hypothetical protein